MATVGRLHYEYLQQTFWWNIIPWFRRFRQVTPVVVEQASRVPSQPDLWNLLVFTLNTSIRSVDDPEYTRAVGDIEEDFSGERHCFQVQISNTTKIYCSRITSSFNPQGSS